MQSRLLYLLNHLFRRSNAKRDLDDEIRAHLAIDAQQRIDAGASPAEARWQAQRDFGNVALVAEVTHETWGWSSLEQFLQDLRHSFRLLRRNSSFTTVSVVSIALGVGLTTAVFSVMDASVLRPLPVHEPDRLFIVRAFHEGKRSIIFNPHFEELRKRQTTLDGMFATDDSPYMRVKLDGDPAPSYIRGSKVSGNYFSVLGVAPALGRLLTDDDDRQPGEIGSTGEPAGNGCAAVISHALWTSRYHQDSSALGRILRVGEIDCTIVGIAPRGFESHLPGYQPDLFVPLRRVTEPRMLSNDRLAFFSGIIGRTRPGVSRAQAEAELNGLHQQIVQGAARPPEEPARPQRRITTEIRLLDASSGLDTIRGTYTRPLTLVLIVVSIVMLIATVNVANLFFARGAARAAELATRTALGASRRRLTTQLALEGSTVALLGGIAGIVVARVATPILASYISLPYLPIAISTQPDHRVMLAALMATGISALIAGVFPALRVTSGNPALAIASANRATTTRSGRRLMRGLVGAQLTLSLLLLATTGLLLRTIVRISSIDPGFRPEHVVVLDVSHERTGNVRWNEEPAEEKFRRSSLYTNLEDRLSAIPGVRSASLSWLNLFGGSDLSIRFADPDNPQENRGARVDYVSTRYFQTVGMQIARGRGFTAADREGALRVAVVNESFVRERYGATPAIGRRLALNYQGEQNKPFTIVGVVRDSRYNDLREKKTDPMVWAPLAQVPFHVKSISLQVESGTQAAVVRQARTAIREAEPQIMVRKEITLSERVAETTARERMMLSLASVFGGLAMLLAAIGLYGTLAYAVVRRTREIGVRVALGAPRSGIARLVISEALVLAVAAIAIGLPLALGAGYALQSFLFEVSPYDPATLAVAALVLTVIAVLAAYLPARRAARVDPLTALRYE